MKEEMPFLAAVSAPSALALRQAAAIGVGIACAAGDGIMAFGADRVEQGTA